MQKVGSTRRNSLSGAALLRRKQKNLNHRSLQLHDSSWKRDFDDHFAHLPQAPGQVVDLDP
jgi:hypothetical protein